MYSQRTQDVKLQSDLRNKCFKIESIHYAVLNQFFNYIKQISKYLTQHEAIETLQNEFPNDDVAYLTKELISELKDIWCSYFTDILASREFNSATIQFEDFLDKLKTKSKFKNLHKKFRATN